MQFTAFPLRLAACLLVAATLACGSREASPGAAGSADAAVDRVPASRSAAGSTSTPGASAGVASPRATVPDSTPRVVILGDSLTAGLGLSPDEAYPALLQRRLDEKGLGLRVINAGVSGDTSAGGIARLDSALEGNVRVLVLALGANDGLRGLPIGQLRNNLAAAIERAQARGVTVMLAGMEAPPNWGEEYTRAFHDVYPSLASQYHVALVPFLLAGVAGNEALNQRDGLHPTAEGDAIVADTVWAVLGPIVEQQAAGARRR
jgi:acyl-CoA thioesterase I